MVRALGPRAIAMAALVVVLTAVPGRPSGLSVRTGSAGARAGRTIPQPAELPAARVVGPPLWDIPAIRRQPAAVKPVRLTATAAILVDARSGQVLFGRNPHLIWPPASTTKIMTALVAVESTPLSAGITISPYVAHFRDGSIVGLPQGARIPLHDLLYALLLPSGNDVALAIAEGTAGTVNAFVARMNAEARRLGATQTHFADPHGLYAPDHYTTAYDLSLITRAALQNPTIRDIVATRKWMFRPPGGPARVLWNHNRLLGRYPGADGVKTGYVHEGGLTLVASATHGHMHLIAVVLHTRDMWGDASRLLSYGFAHYRPVALAHRGETLALVELPHAVQPVIGTVTSDMTVDAAPGQSVVRRVTVGDALNLPVRRGDRIGDVTFLSGGRIVRVAPLVAAGNVTSVRTGLNEVVDWIDRTVGRLLGAMVL